MKRRTFNAGLGALAATGIRISGTIVAASFLGNVVHYEVKPRSGQGLMRVEGAFGVPLEPGAEVALTFDPKHTFAIPRSQ